MKNLVVLTGAGISAPSGIKTFRDAEGLWEGHDIITVASPKGWMENPELVLDFYNLRRRQLKEVHPNKAHELLQVLEAFYNVDIITQNVDNLHERAGSKNIIHLHGELLKARPEDDKENTFEWTEDIHIGDTHEGSQIRPHIVWFGEPVPKMEEAKHKVARADIFIIIGTSLQVYPAAGLCEYVRPNSPIIYIDNNPSEEALNNSRFYTVAEDAITGLQSILDTLITNA